MVDRRLFLFLFSTFFLPSDAFNISHFKKFPFWLVDGPCLNKQQYWSFVTEYCPGSSDDHTELFQYYMMAVFTNSTTDPPRIEGTTLWDYEYSKRDGNGIRGSLAENNRCGRCGTFLPCQNSGSYKRDFAPFVRVLELHKANQLGVEMFIWIKRKSGVTGDNEMNYYPDPHFFNEYKDKGNRKRYENGKNDGAIRYKRVKVIGFAPMDSEDGMKLGDDSEYVLADVVNDCETLDPKTHIPSHGMYRLMINGEARGKKSSFWWKNQYYFPMAGDYFT